MNRSSRGIVPLVLIAAVWPAASAFSALAAAGREGQAAVRPPAASLTRPASPAKPTGADGFIQRWLVLEPIRVPGQLTEAAVRSAVEKDFPVPAAPLPRDGDTLTIGDSTLEWHAVDTLNYNVNLYHFAYALNKPTTNVLFWAVTVVNAPREMRGVRLAIGSNAASVWWVNGREATALYNDRQAVIDDGVSKRLTLNQGANVVRAAIVNAGGATDFCARFLDENDRPIRTLTATLTATGRDPMNDASERSERASGAERAAKRRASDAAGESEGRSPSGKT